MSNNSNNNNSKSLESWIWSAACFIRGAKENSLLNGIINRVDFNATTHGQRDLDDDRLSNLIEAEARKTDKALWEILDKIGV